MNPVRLAAAILLAATAAGVHAQAKITHTPIPCVRGGRAHILEMGVADAGELRLFYRKPTMTWCTVTGFNRGMRSSVPLPTLNNGDEIEYFAVLVQGRQVVARTEQIYNVRAHERCDVPAVRMQQVPASDCTRISHLFGQSQAAAFAMPEAPPPDEASPSTPQ